MPIDPRKRQKKQQRHAAKRKAKQHQLSKQKSAGLAERLAAAAGYPVLHSGISESVWDQGIGQVFLSRLLPSGQVAFAVFLVDVYCLGVKDAMSSVISRSTYDSKFGARMRPGHGVTQASPACVRKLVEGAAEYARGLGLHPHPDYFRARPLFGTIEATECAEEFPFGKDGKPFFVAGPYDTPDRCRQILNALVQSCGVDGFHFMLPLADPRSLPAALAHRGTEALPDHGGVGPRPEIELLEDEDLDEEDETSEPAEGL
jgi:hypothetical protein